MNYGTVCIKCDLEPVYCPLNHAIRATVIWEPKNHCRIFDAGRSHARMTNFQKRYFIETVENNETNFGHKNTPHMYSSRFQKHLYDKSALSRFDVLTKPLYKCNEDRPYYATQCQDIFIQHREGFNLVSGKPSPDIDEKHVIVPERPASLTPYTKANIRDGYVIPQESQL